MELDKNNLHFNFPKRTKTKRKLTYIMLGVVLLCGINIFGLLSYPRNDFVKQFYDPPPSVNKYEQYNYQQYLKAQAEIPQLALEYVQILQSQKYISVKETIRQIQKNASNNPIMHLYIKENKLRLKPDLNYNRYYQGNNKYIIDFNDNTVSILNIERKNIETFQKQLAHRIDLLVSESINKDETGTDVPSLTIKIITSSLAFSLPE